MPVDILLWFSSFTLNKKNQLINKLQTKQNSGKKYCEKKLVQTSMENVRNSTDCELKRNGWLFLHLLSVNVCVALSYTPQTPRARDRWRRWEKIDKTEISIRNFASRRIAMIAGKIRPHVRHTHSFTSSSSSPYK